MFFFAILLGVDDFYWNTQSLEPSCITFRGYRRFQSCFWFLFRSRSGFRCVRLSIFVALVSDFINHTELRQRIILWHPESRALLHAISMVGGAKHSPQLSWPAGPSGKLRGLADLHSFCCLKVFCCVVLLIRHRSRTSARCYFTPSLCFSLQFCWVWTISIEIPRVSNLPALHFEGTVVFNHAFDFYFEVVQGSDVFG
jgi:hypothetical protein